jgi:Domain of unknown function (DUF4936)
MGRALFVYYRVRVDDGAAVLDALRALQASLPAAIAGLRCERWQRETPNDGLLTLMETYSADGDIDAAQQSLIESHAAAALASWIVGERHTEVFLRCA